LLDAVETSRSAQDRFVASVLPACGNGSDDPLEGLPLLHQWPGSELLDRLRTLDAGRDPEAEGGIETIPLVAPVLGGVGAFLNFMSWSAMKSLAGTVGENGLAAAIRTCQEELGAVGKTRIHLAGHSLGGRLMAASCKALARQGALPVASLSLLEAAFSHYGFSPEAGWGEPGFFREVLESRIVAGAVLSTFSKLDTVVGTAYAVASRLACDRLRAIGDAADPYGGIGHNGAQRTPEAVFEALHDAGVPYQFRAGVPTCLDGSSGTITGHGDITNREVTYAIASAIGRAA
jgi:pimeloyl-ACP methyl ester carboxylesterase